MHKFLFTLSILLTVFHNIFSANEIRKLPLPRVPVNITITAIIDEKGKWESEVEVHNCDKNDPKYLLDVRNKVGDNGMNFSATIEDSINLQITCARKKETVPNSNKLRSDYIFKENLGFYKFHAKTEQWGTAKKICENEDAYLIIVDSQGEADMVVEEMKNRKYGTMYIGVHDHFLEGDFVTIKGNSLMTSGYWKWNTGSPNGAKNENCVYMLPTGLLDDCACTQSYYFACEREMDE